MTGSFTGALFSTNPIKEFLYVRRTKQKNSSKNKTDEIKERKIEEKFFKNIKPNIISSAKIATGMIPKGEITLVVAAIGLMVGLGNYTLPIIATIIAFFVLRLGEVEKKK